MAVKPDPPIPADGGCAHCGGPRKHAHWNRHAGDQAEQDPFCTTTCAREWHGCPLEPTRITNEKAA